MAFWVVGGSTIAYGVSNLAEGTQDIYYGSVGDVSTVAFNPIRDTVFCGNEYAYTIWGVTNETLASALTVVSCLCKPTDIPKVAEFENIGNESTAVETVAGIADDMINEANSIWGDISENGVTSVKFSNLEDMKEAYKGTVTKFVTENKPKYSPDIKKWFNKGGTIEISNVDGKQIWTYTSSSGETVPYVNGYIQFPDEYLNPTIKSVDIGKFTGDRGKDIEKMINILESDYGITEIPDGYVVHHSIKNGVLQLVDESIHEKFTHIGGYSMYR